MKKSIAILFAAAAGVISTPVPADTSDVKWQSMVTVKKKGAHCVDDPN